MRVFARVSLGLFELCARVVTEITPGQVQGCVWAIRDADGGFWASPADCLNVIEDCRRNAAFRKMIPGIL